MKVSNKKWIVIYFSTLLLGLAGVALIVAYIDPFFHYHKPLTNKYFYLIDNERSHNPGILDNFDYDAILTGTSMTNNFKTSMVDSFWDTTSVKVSVSGARFKETDQLIRRGIENNNIKLVIRSLDMDWFFEDKDAEYELGVFPDYLYNNNIFDDVEYLFNRDVIFNRCWTIFTDYRNTKIRNGEMIGNTSFDEAYSWRNNGERGKEYVLKGRDYYSAPQSINALTEDDKQQIKASVEQNIINTVAENPQIDFYYFFTPYSVAWWGNKYESGELERQLEAEKYIIELLIPYENLHLFSYNNMTDITSDLNSYQDPIHYKEEINDLILEMMYEGKGRLTKDNYEDYCKKETDFYREFDYEGLR